LRLVAEARATDDPVELVDVAEAVSGAVGDLTMQVMERADPLYQYELSVNP
jgi:hypothetical protein